MASVPTSRATLFKGHRLPPGSLRSPRNRKMTPRLPQELIDRIIDLVAARESNTKMQDLKACSLTARSWSCRSQRHVLESIIIPSFNHLFEWASEVDPTNGASSYVRTLTLCDNLTWRFSPNTLAQLERNLAAFDRLESLTLKGFHIHSDIRHSEFIPKWFGRFKDTLKSLSLESCSLSPNAFQSILHLFPLLDNVSISNDCQAVIATEDDRALKPRLGDVTHFRGSLVTGISTLQEFLPCLLMVPLRLRRLVCAFSAEGNQIVSASAPTLQTLFFEGSLHQFLRELVTDTAPLLADRSIDDVQVNPISFPELHTFEFWIGDWDDVEPMVHHYFPLIGSAPNLSTIRIDVNEETKDSDILSLRDSSGWEEVDLQLCRLAKGARGPVTLVLDAVLSLESSNKKDPFGTLTGSQFLSEFLEARGRIQFE